MTQNSISLFIEEGRELPVKGESPVSLRVKVGPVSIRTAPNRENVNNPQFNWEISMAYHNQGVEVQVLQVDQVISTCQISNFDLISGVSGVLPLTPSGNLQLKAKLSEEVVEGAKVKRVCSAPTASFAGQHFARPSEKAAEMAVEKAAERLSGPSVTSINLSGGVSFADLVKKQNASMASEGTDLEASHPSSSGSTLLMNPQGSFIVNVGR